MPRLTSIVQTKQRIPKWNWTIMTKVTFFSADLNGRFPYRTIWMVCYAMYHHPNDFWTNSILFLVFKCFVTPKTYRSRWRVFGVFAGRKNILWKWITRLACVGGLAVSRESCLSTLIDRLCYAMQFYSIRSLGHCFGITII